MRRNNKIFGWAILGFALVAVGCYGASPKKQSPPVPCFTATERQAIVRYGNMPGRYAIVPLLSRINSTPEGAAWMRKYRSLPQNPQWDVWLKTTLAKEHAAPDVQNDNDIPAPPTDLVDMLGTPPRFYETVTPHRYTVHFDDDKRTYNYEDNLPFAGRAAYFTAYQSRLGVRVLGKRLREYTGAEKSGLQHLMANAFPDERERRIVTAVSALEGGFEAVNTYDTGYISVGFIQFTTGANGDGSLSVVLQAEKRSENAAFARDFHRFGVDVSDDGILCVVNPQTGEATTGNDAVQTVIADKRLTAVFERAGASEAFRRAQLMVARARYFPSDDMVRIRLRRLIEQATPTDMPVVRATVWGDGDAAENLLTKAMEAAGQIHGETGDDRLRVEETIAAAPMTTVFKSEAGMATLFDRKVQTGNLRMVSDAVAKILRDKKLSKIEDAAMYERDLIIAVRNRADFLTNANLGQPKPQSQP